MTIDELIEMLNSEDCRFACILKEYTKTVYNTAIDDFVKFANTLPAVEMEDGEIRPMWLEEIAERLKKE